MQNNYMSNRLVLGVIFILLSVNSQVFSVSSPHVKYKNSSTVTIYYNGTDSIRNQKENKSYIVVDEL